MRLRSTQSPRPPRSRALSRIVVRKAPGDARRGILVAGSFVLPCALGRGGIVRGKREGDGGTPAGTHRLLGGFYRADRLGRPAGTLPFRAIRPGDGWCDDPRSPAYNRPVRLPSRFGHEVMWRNDGLYDCVIDIAWNRGPIARGRGSAIFLHLARDGLKPTEGCVAVPRARLAHLLPRIGRRTRLVVL